ncbi:MAG: hypothetical protein OER83_02445 [Flavobacteriaceae bacterium]|nr:hypothetical protein [Flavobacteriaceae bacterium]
MKRLVFFAILILTGCTNYGQLQFVSKLPKKLNEVSGIVPAANDTYWVIEDSGNADNLYRVNLKGELLQDVNIKNAKNRDWEALSRDTLETYTLQILVITAIKGMTWLFIRFPNLLPNRKK